MSILIKISNGQPIPFMWHLFVLLFILEYKHKKILPKYWRLDPGYCSSYAFYFSSTIFWAVDLLTPVSAAVLYHTRFSDGFIPDFFSSMQNLYTFSIIAPASSLYLHTSLAILLSEVALHVHNTSEHAFFCKHVNREKFLLLCESKK